MTGIPEGYEIVEDVPEGYEVVEDTPTEPKGGFLRATDRALVEFASSINRSVLETVDFFGTEVINSMLSGAGIDKGIPSLAESAKKFGIGEKGFMDEGLPRDIVQATGEVIPAAVGMGSLLRSTAKNIPKLASPAESVTTGLIRDIGKTTGAGDIALGGSSGAGSAIGREFGGEEGALVGSFLAPIGAIAAQKPISALMSKGQSGIKSLFTTFDQSVKGMSDEGAARVLGEALVREGLSPADAVKRFKDLGPDAIPADMGASFTRYLNAAARMAPRIEGAAGQAFAERQAGQSARIMDAFDDATGTSSLSLADEVARLDNIFAPKISELYSAARSAEFAPSQKISKLMTESPSLSQARSKAMRTVRDKQALGEESSGIDVIDQTKRQLDDQIGRAIRDGENNRAMDLVELKNAMVGEADKAVPAYKQARDMYAGKAQLENAGNMGEMFFKIKPADMSKMTQSMSESEKKMFKLGAKQAIVDKMDNLQMNSDAVKRLFGKGGDVKKLRFLFDTPEAFDGFSKSMEREARFILTRNAAQKTSGTPQQIIDTQSGSNALSEAANLISNPAAGIGKIAQIFKGLGGSKSDLAAANAWAKAGDILLQSGIKPDRLQRILTDGKEQVIKNEIRKALNLTPALEASIAEQLAEPVN